MALFRILRGESSRIDQNTTEFHDGYAYFTPDDGGFYIDAESGGEQKRIRINPKQRVSEDAAQVEISINDETYEIGASIAEGAIGPDNLADEVKASLEKADVAQGYTDEKIAEMVGSKPVIDQISDAFDAYVPPTTEDIGAENYMLPTSNAVYSAAVLYNQEQSLTVDQQEQARKNISAAAMIDKALIIQSSTIGSTKCFKLTIDDDGVMTASEIV